MAVLNEIGRIKQAKRNIIDALQDKLFGFELAGPDGDTETGDVKIDYLAKRLMDLIEVNQNHEVSNQPDMEHYLIFTTLSAGSLQFRVPFEHNMTGDASYARRIQLQYTTTPPTIYDEDNNTYIENPDCKWQNWLIQYNANSYNYKDTQVFYTDVIPEGTHVYVRGIIGNNISPREYIRRPVGDLSGIPFQEMEYLLENEEYGPGTFENLPYCTVSGNLAALFMQRQYDVLKYADTRGIEALYANLFRGCNKLLSVSLIDTVSNNGIEAGDTLPDMKYCGMFRDCNNLQYINYNNILGLISSDCIPGAYTYAHVFDGCENLSISNNSSSTNASPIRINNVAQGSHAYAYRNCKGFTGQYWWQAIPSCISDANVTLPPYCFCGMFEGCENIQFSKGGSGTAAYTNINATPSEGSYMAMFKGCKDMRSYPRLLFTEVGDFGCVSMFEGCTQINNSDGANTTLTSIGKYGCAYMFADNFTNGSFYGNPVQWTADTVIDEGSFMGMFRGDGHWNAPTLPHTTLTPYCYAGMFEASNLSNIPSLPATTLAPHCYEGMFRNCICPNTAYINLPATNLEPHCYESMFEGTRLNWNGATAILPATVAQEDCYKNMFRNSIGIKTITMNILNDDVIGWQNWLDNAGTGHHEGVLNVPETTIIQDEQYGVPEWWDINPQSTQVDFTVSDINDTGKEYVRIALQYEVPEGSTAELHLYIDGTEVTLDANDSYSLKKPGITKTYDIKATAKIDGLRIGIARRGVELIPCINYFAIENVDEQAGNIAINIGSSVNTNYATSLSYSFDKTNWTTTAVDSTAQTITIPVGVGNKVYLKGIANSWYLNSNSTKGYTNITSDVDIAISGCVASLLFGDNHHTQFTPGGTNSLGGLFLNNTHLVDASDAYISVMCNGCCRDMFQGCTRLVTPPILYPTTANDVCYQYMFRGCTSLTTAPELPATVLAMRCYEGMFQGCTSLTTAPELPATQLSPYCYSNMFYGCTSLTTAPELPATNLATSCYESMFQGCTNLTTAPSILPATIIYERGYYHMFEGCTSLTTAPELPATTLSTQCYSYMFSGCTSLTTAPELPAMTLATECYNCMFKGCTSLTTAPELPATTIYGSSYNSMFENCTSLTTAPELPAMTLATRCYESMFQGCTALTTAPELPATTLNQSGATHCYQYMFKGCTSLTTAPELPIISFVNSYGSGGTSIYAYMFQGCTKLTSAPELPATVLATRCYEGMFQGCTKLTSAPSILPATTLNAQCYQYMFQGCTKLTSAPELPATTLNAQCYSFMFQGCTNLTTVPAVLPALRLAGGCYQYMFSGCTSLTTAPELPATVLGPYCYENMFQGCTALTTAPTLSSINLTRGCYKSMFEGCTKLTSAPELPAKGLMPICYAYMFSGCAGLTATPALPATKIAPYSYAYMFQGCTGLTATPALPATVIGSQSYKGMFQNCTKLTTVPAVLPANEVGVESYREMFQGTAITAAPELPATKLAQGCYRSMFYDCKSLVVAPILPATTLAEDCYQRMFWGNTALTTVPTLPAITLVKNCYREMFTNCSRLNYIKALFTTTPKDAYTYHWVTNVASSGTFVKNVNATWTTADTNGKPSSWTTATTDPYKDVDLNNNPIAYDYDSRKYLGFEVTDDNGAKFRFSNNILYKTTGEWKELTANTLTPDRFTKGTKVFFKQNPNSTLTPNGTSGIGQFSSTGTFKAFGNIMSLLYSSSSDESVAVSQVSLSGKNYAFANLFNGCTYLTDIRGLILQATTLSDYCYFGMFKNCTGLINAEIKLPAATLTQYCYSEMFMGCTNLIDCPDISLGSYPYGKPYSTDWDATGDTDIKQAGLDRTLNVGCCKCMFKNCSSLRTPPYLFAVKVTSKRSTMYDDQYNVVATTIGSNLLSRTNAALADYVFQEMFMGCSSLIDSPLSIGYTPYQYSHNSMFEGCTSLTYVRSYSIYGLSQNTHTSSSTQNNYYNEGQYCYANMFKGCTGLTDASDLFFVKTSNTAYTIYHYAYTSMFEGCTSLISMPTTLITNNIYTQATSTNSRYRGLYCYSSMFKGCTSLSGEINLQIGSFRYGRDYVYSSMFEGCTGLTRVNINFVTTYSGPLQYNCLSMFKGCTGLTDVYLHFQSSNNGTGYNWGNEMFMNCSSLNHISFIANSSQFIGTGYTKDWVSGVAANGTFETSANITAYGTSSIPTGWTKVSVPYTA